MNKKLLYKELEEWYEVNHRILPWRETEDPYKIWISEIILQQTRVAQGMEYYHRLVTRFPDIQSLADAQEDEVLLYWQGLGYYSRARNMHKAAQLMKNHEIFHLSNVECLKLKDEEIFAALKSMPGVGDYTAGAIASFAFDLPYPALDGNVYRVLSRLYDCEIAFDTTQGKKHFRQLAEDLLDREHPRLFNSAIMELGALHCVPTAPDCPTCPLNTWCKALANNTVELLPVRKPRPKVRDRYLEYTIYITPEKTTLIHQRKGNDIWKHLWEFVETTSVDGLKNDNIDNLRGNQLPAALQGENSTQHNTTLHHSTLPQAISLTHVLSHQKLHARFVIKNVPELPKIPDTVVVGLNDLDNYAFSRLTLNAIEKLLIPHHS
jgi:A/G-specific adenine glycosylase